MSFPLNDTVEKSPLQESLTHASWEEKIVPLLPKDLEESAWLLGAMTRKGGKIQSASDLLRGLLVYTMCVTSFRLLGAWGVISGVADLADTSWRERARKSGAWLSWVLNELMQPEKQNPCPQLKKAGYGPIELVDASHLKCVGPKGKVIRFHCLYALLTQQLHQVVVSTTKVAESIANFCIQAGAIYVFDAIWLAEHHFELYGRMPDPLLFLSRISGITQHIGLGTAIVEAPHYNPLRLAEDAALLDVLSNGRVRLGVGSGGANKPAELSVSVSRLPKNLLAPWKSLRSYARRSLMAEWTLMVSITSIKMSRSRLAPSRVMNIKFRESPQSATIALRASNPHPALCGAHSRAVYGPSR